MPDIFKYKIALDADYTIDERSDAPSSGAIGYIAFALVGTTITTVFSALVMVLNYCFPGSLEGTYLKLFF